MNSAYSKKFSTAEKQHIIHLKDLHGEERAEMLVRNKKLQKETNQRRKAIAIKRKREAQLEEKRRNEILNKRKEQIREATERFQRLNRHYDPKDYTDDPYKQDNLQEGGPTLEDALRAIRSSPKPPFRQSSAGSIRNRSSVALARHASAGSYRQPPNLARQESEGTHANSAGSVHGAATAGPQAQSQLERTRQHAREVAARTELRSRSVRNMSSSRNMFEQQLDQHQQFLIDNQQQSLHQFNEAIHQEMANDRKIQGLEETDERMVLHRSDSVDSVDSLEAEAALAAGQMPPQQAPPDADPCHASSAPYSHATSVPQYQTSPAVGHAAANRSSSYTSSTYASPGNVAQPGAYGHNPSSSFVVHRSSSSPSVAVVQPSVVQPSVYDVTLPNSHAMQQQVAGRSSRAPSSYPELQIEDVNENGYDEQCRPQEFVPGRSESYGVITTKSNGRYNGQYYQDSFGNYNTDQARQPPVEGDRYSGDHKETSFAQGVNVGNAGVGNTWATPISMSNQDASDAKYTTNAPNAYNVMSNPPAVNSATMLTSGKHHIPGATAASNMSGTYTVNHRNGSAPVSKPAATTASTNIVTAPNSYHSIQSAARGSAHASTAQRSKQPSSKPQKPAPVVEEQKSDSGSDVQEEAEPVPAPAAAIKSILKKTASPIAIKPESQPRVRGGGYARRGLYTRATKTNASVRDSIEVTREQLSSRQEHKKPKRRGVRWTDMSYDEDSENQSGEDPIEEEPFEPPPPKPVPQKAKEPPTKKASRPISAKVSTATPEVDSIVKVARSASAGTSRRGPFLRPHPPSHPPSGRAATGARPHARPSEVSPPQARGDGSRIPVSAPKPIAAGPSSRGYDSSAYTTPSGPQISNGVSTGGTPGDVTSSAIYDTNGMRLDRTPTDDEINWLWDKVRTCLNRESSASSVVPDQATRQSAKASPANRQPVRASTNNRAASNYHNNYMGSGLPARRKVTMETLNNYANRRSSLLSQRRQQQPNVGTISYHTATDENIQPIQSTTAPNTTATTFADQDVTESMAAFLTAEMLAEHGGSMSESQIEEAMQTAQLRQHMSNTSRPSQKVPSALSIEEQRLMQSLDRLNEKLKITDPTFNATGPMVPRPPTHPQHPQYANGSFRGKAPLSTSSKRAALAVNGTVPRQHFRISSAGARDQNSNVGAASAGHVRYR